MRDIVVTNRPDLVRYARQLAQNLALDIKAGRIGAGDLSAMKIENKLLMKRGRISPLFMKVNCRVLTKLHSELSGTGLGCGSDCTGLGSLDGFWDTVKQTAEDVYSKGSDILTDVGGYLDVDPADINLPDIDRALKDIAQKGLIRISPEISPDFIRSMFGLPPWVIPAGIGLILFMMFRRR